VSFQPSGIVTLLTDFGTRDEYVGTMKCRILTVFPLAVLVDITHEVAAQDIMEGALILGNSYRHFPPGTVHCVVVDPGVGSRRKPIVVTAGGYAFVGPDNGVFSRVYATEEDVVVREIRNPKLQRNEISDTFHGRDIFAPVAGHLASGTSPEDVGPVLSAYVEIHPPEPDTWNDTIKGEVIHIDGFGNLITNISRELFQRCVGDRPFVIECNGRRVTQLSRTYEDGEWGRFLALFGSTGMLEISVRGGSAEKRIGAGKGDKVVVMVCEGGRQPDTPVLF
jgi:hypothetical protein